MALYRISTLPLSNATLLLYYIYAFEAPLFSVLYFYTFCVFEIVKTLTTLVQFKEISIQESLLSVRPHTQVHRGLRKHSLK